ncbi:MAG: hypothetical protein CM1200mP36_10110 [Gammaproteobacteria bacterium]|nr:MAG: hypothetical protein CM1200mP36_10110 [Gammaproteobacteria bacterium]
MGGRVEPRWTDRTIEMSETRRAAVGFTSAPELGMFRIWSTPDTIPMLVPRDLGGTAAGRANLTQAALGQSTTSCGHRTTRFKTARQGHALNYGGSVPLRDFWGG